MALGFAASGCGGRRDPSFAKRFDVGGYKLYLECRGSGKPVVILDAGLGSGHEAWQPVERKLAGDDRVCAYDRAGIEQSDPRPVSPVPVGRGARELHRLLREADVKPPYVYVGHSIGGIYSLAYTAAYPGEVAGAVYVDATNPADTGVLPDGSSAVGFSDPYEPLRPRLGARPAIYLAAVNTGDGYLDGARNGRLVQATGSGHSIQDDRPALVIEAVREVVTAARSGDSLPACSNSRLPRLGGRCAAGQ